MAESLARRIAYERGVRGWSRDHLAKLLTPAGAPIRGAGVHRIEIPQRQRGGARRVGNFRRDTFDRAAVRIGIPGLHPHELRHTAASLAIASGASIKVVQSMLGTSRRP